MLSVSKRLDYVVFFIDFVETFVSLLNVQGVVVGLALGEYISLTRELIRERRAVEVAVGYESTTDRGCPHSCNDSATNSSTNGDTCR